MKAESLYTEMLGRLWADAVRVKAAGAMGNRAAVLSEARALVSQAGALVELLEGELSEEGKFKGRKEQV